MPASSKPAARPRLRSLALCRPGLRGARPWTRLAGLSLATLAATSCRLIEADAYNLDQLHGADGRHRYSAALEGNFEYIVRHQFGALFPNSNLSQSKSPSPVKNPSGQCLTKMLRLAGYDSASPTVASRQVEWFSRLAVDDDAILSRERALIELGKAAERLDVGPRELDAQIVPAGPAALSEALASLSRAVTQSLSREGSEEMRKADLTAAVDLVEGLDLDLDGSRRALRVTTELLKRGGLFSRATPELERLNLHLQRVCVERSLARALDDDDPLVRAAALEAVVRARGPEALAPLLMRLALEPTEVASRTLPLDIKGLLDQHQLEVLLLEKPLYIQRPQKLGPTNVLADAEPPDYLASIYRVVELLRDEGHLRVKAMQALSATSGSGIVSLREEDWQAWWFARRSAGPEAGSQSVPVQGSQSTGPARSGSAGTP